MSREELVKQIFKKKSFLCVGLDTDIEKIPSHLLQEEDPLFAFNKIIIDATHDLCIAFKPNIAFYEAHGAKGWISLEKTINYLNENYPDIFTIADAKRGDIGNTSGMYARAFLKNMDFDSITVAPYMGEDSVTPFFEIRDKWVILLALTSNKGALDFQTLSIHHHIPEGAEEKLFEKVIHASTHWGNKNNLMFVAGATQASMLRDIRKIIPDHFLLVPGVGAQGGNLSEVIQNGKNNDGGLIINASRSIIYASSGKDFAGKAREEAEKMQKDMAGFF